MALAPGTRLGVYDITAQIGEGGMGQVYRATDTKLKRQVAIKILPPALAADANRLARFQREAEVLASLNHPHIAAIYGLEESGGMTALVMELVEGEDLSQRIVRGAIPLDETLPIARQIADALEAAHEQEIIHRDLKPANIKVRADGTVKVLDFGLAKAMEPTGAMSVSNSMSPTITTPAMTQAGMILGTAAYMSPEQARGKTVDKRSDIWAFGCVLYEMLTGKCVFAGDDMSDVLAFIITKEPDWAALPAATPAAICRLLRRCLEKDRKERLPDIGVARLEIKEALTMVPAGTIPSATLTAVRPVARWRRIAAFAAVALVASTLTGVALWLTMRPNPPRVSRLTITPPSAAALTISGSDRDLAITPDGTRIVYAGANGLALFVRTLDQLDATRLTGLGNPRGPFLSPDGQWIGFADANTMLKKVAVTGGPSVLLGRLDGGQPRGATWGPDDTIVFATGNIATGLHRIPAAGGEPIVLTRPNRAGGENDHVWPEFLPNGQAVLFTITATTGGLDAASIAVLDLRTGAQTILIRGGSHAHFVRSGHLVYGAAGTLRAVPFDLARRAVVGPAVPVVSAVMTTPPGAVDAVVSADGTLVYVPAGSGANTERTLVWVDRQGREEPITAPPRAYMYPRLSPDGTRVAFYLLDQENDIWLWDLARATLTRVTFDSGTDNYPAWMPDSRRLLFSSDRAARNLFGQAADGTGPVEQLTDSPTVKNPTSVSPDGTRLVFTEIAPGTNENVMTLTLSGERPSTGSGRGEPVEPRRAAPPSLGFEPGRSSASAPPQAQGVVSPSNHEVRPLIQTAFVERNGEVSPDGRWLAYEANDSGRAEIYVRPFPDVTGGRWQISTGTRPLWARSGKELFYLGPTGAVMSASVEGGSTFRAGNPARLFEGPYLTTEGQAGRTYDVSPDGQRFLMIKVGNGADETAAPASLIVVENWFEELKRIVPTK